MKLDKIKISLIATLILVFFGVISILNNLIIGGIFLCIVGLFLFVFIALEMP